MAKYIVHYVENCAPKLRFFDKKEKAESFISKIKKESKEDGTWFDFLVKGELVSNDAYYSKFKKTK